METFFVLLLFVPFYQCAESPARSPQAHKLRRPHPHETKEIVCLQEEIFRIFKILQELERLAEPYLRVLPNCKEPLIADGNEHFLFKHDWRLPIEWRDPLHKPVPENVNEDVANAAELLHFHGYDEFMPTYVPKYLQRYYPTGDDATVFPEAAAGEREQPTLSKTISRHLFVRLTRNGEKSRSILPIRMRHEGVGEAIGLMECDVKMHQSDALYFETPFHVRETRHPYISFFHEIDQWSVYTWLPFIDNESRVTFVVQIWVINPTVYFEMLHEFNQMRLMQVKNNINSLLNVHDEEYGLQYVGMNKDYKLPMYAIGHSIDRNSPELEEENFPSFEGNRPPVFNLNFVVKDRYLAIRIEERNIYLQDRKKNLSVDFAIFPIYNEVKGIAESYRSKIGVLNDFRQLFVLPFAVGNILNYVADIHFDKYGRYYAWIPFTDAKSRKLCLIQVSLLRSEKYAQLATAEHLFARYGYYTSDYIDYFQIPKTPAVRDKTLERRTNYLNLAITYVPTTCAQLIRDRKWVSTEMCEKSKWVIHGLWQEDHEIYGKRRRNLCLHHDGWRDPWNIVQTEDDVPEGYKNISGSVAARFINDIEWWDYQWCSHGYFMMKNNIDPRFDRPMDYFDTIIKFYRILNFDSIVKQLQPKKYVFYTNAEWKIIHERFGRPLPVLHNVRLDGDNITGVVQLVFCFDSVTEQRVECSKEMKEKQAPKFANVYYPPSYEAISYVALRLRMTLRKPFLKIKGMIPSFIYNYIHLNYLQDREFLMEAFDQQMLHDYRYERSIDDFERYWFLDGINLLEELKDVFRFTGLALYQMKKRINNPMDYFTLVTRLYKNITINDWFDYPLGVAVTKHTLSRRFAETSKLELYKARVILLCKVIDGLYYLQEIRICYSTDTLTVISCPSHEFRGRGLNKNEHNIQRKSCNEDFMIPSSVDQIVD